MQVMVEGAFASMFQPSAQWWKKGDFKIPVNLFENFRSDYSWGLDNLLVFFHVLSSISLIYSIELSTLMRSLVSSFLVFL